MSAHRSDRIEYVRVGTLKEGMVVDLEDTERVWGDIHSNPEAKYELATVEEVRQVGTRLPNYDAFILYTDLGNYKLPGSWLIPVVETVESDEP